MPIQPAQIRFDPQGNAFSEAFDDIYFNPDDAIGKTNHLFHRATRFDEQLAALPPDQPFIVGELGFGLGLNFLGTLTKFNEQAPASNRLHYVAVEFAPPSVEQLRQTLRHFDAWRDEIDELLAEWPGRIDGVHRLRLTRCDLTLHLGDVDEVLPGIDARADAWFLDGFAPDKNPAMWSNAVAQQLFRLTKPGGRLGSYTAAGHVRRALAEAGFEVERLPGDPFKRHIIAASKPIGESPAVEQPTKPKTIALVGAGWAGLSVADELHQRGHKVVVVDAAGPRAGASGNRDAICAPVLDAATSPRQDFYRSAFVLASRRHPRVGVLRRPAPRKDETFLRQAAELFGDLDGGFEWKEDGLHGLWMPNAGVASFHEFAAGVIARLPETACRWPFAIQEIERTEETWQLVSSDGEAVEADAVVLACAAALKKFTPTADWPLRSIRGQVSHITATEQSAKQRHAVVGEAYLCPARDGVHSVGATFAPDDLESDERAADHDDNRRRAGLTDQQWTEAMDWSAPTGRVGFRVNTPDYLPMIGPVPDMTRCRTYATSLPANTVPTIADWPTLPGLYAAAALGAHGVISSALAAALITDAIDRTPPPCSADAAAAVHPGRYLTRAAKKRQPIGYPTLHS
ncbi:MAG: FAD-dependent 5-carboxymethylaminomethyl-2-thiouridine(34) oxidoreductase MnmC [Planctomycetota bacterium]